MELKECGPRTPETPDELACKTGYDPSGLTSRLDALFLHPVLSYLVFAVIMWALFTLTFRLGALPAEGIRWLVDAISHQAMRLLPDGFIKSLLVDGLIAGVGGVIVFLPNIVILFFGLSILEESGYMARASFVMDKVMHKMGLHGRSFVPMVMGLGCNVPAMLAARSLKNRSDRIITVLVAPLISCSARLPIYVLFAGAFFPAHAGNVVFLMYVLSFVFAFGLGLLFRKALFRRSEPEHVFELAPYHRPSVRNTLNCMWENTRHYLNRIGTVVVIFSVILFLLGHYPETHDKNIEGTYIGKMGELVSPVLQSAGFDLKMDISLIAGFAAKEMVVGTLGVLFSAEHETQGDRVELRNALRRHYTPLQAFCFMLFCLLYTPCIASIVTMYRELNHKAWFLFGLTYPIVIAWVTSSVIFKAGTLLGF